jgi:hypothetical protein
MTSHMLRSIVLLAWTMLLAGMALLVGITARRAARSGLYRQAATYSNSPS